MPIKKYLVYALLFLAGIVSGAAVCLAGLYAYALSNFHFPGDGPLYSFAGWRGDLDVISASQINRYAKPLPYTLLNIDGEAEKEKYYSSFTVNALLDWPANEASPSQLAATCAAGVKYYAQKYQKDHYRPEAAHFIIYENRDDQHREDWRIMADCLYSPKGLGWDELEEHPWTWLDLRVRQRPFTAKELQVKNTLAAMHAHHERLKIMPHTISWEREDTGRLTGMSDDEVFKIETFKNRVLFPASVFKNIEPEGPVNSRQK